MSLALPAATYLLAINNGSGTATAPIGFTVTPWLGALSAVVRPGRHLRDRTGHRLRRQQVANGHSRLGDDPGAGTTNSSGSTRPGSPVGFTIPSGLPNGPVTVAVTDGTHTATATFTVGGAGAGPPGVANPGGLLLTAGQLSGGHQRRINYWNGTTFPQPALTASQCLGTGHNPNQDIQQITISGAAPGATDQLNTVVANPQYVPTPAISTTLYPASSPQVGGQLVFDATVTGPPATPPLPGTSTGRSAPRAGRPRTAPPRELRQRKQRHLDLHPARFAVTASTYSVTAVYRATLTKHRIQHDRRSGNGRARSANHLGHRAQPDSDLWTSGDFTATVSVPANAPAPTGR